VTDNSTPELVARIRAEIDRAGGAIPFARFMELALYEPEHGYYRRRQPGPGRAGADFLTAPETHPIFGAAVARQIREVRDRLGVPARFTIREYAAGGGALAGAILRELGPGVRYEAVEPNAFRRAELEARVPGAIAFAEAPQAAFEGIVVANELLDAFPVHRVVVRAGRLLEVHVGWGDGRFVDVESDPSTPALAARLADEGIALGEGQQAEISLGIAPWLAEVARDLRRGAVLLIDYGYAAADLYSPQRGAGTLLGYSGHRVVDDPYANVGRQDLTAHVDFSAVERAAEGLGFDVLGRTSQAEFLVGVGAEELVERVRS
jgi:SAM-dependent MidA family methyltransferase